MVKKILSALIISSFLPITSLAQSVINDYANEEKKPQNDWTGFIAAGAAMLPEFDGSKDYQTIPILSGQFNKGNYYIATRGLGIFTNIIDSQQFNGGPIVNFRFGRDSDVKNDTISRLRTVDDAIEVGAFASYIIRDSLKPGDNLELSISVMQDVAGGHGGLLAGLSASFFVPINRDLRLGVNTGLDYQSSDYMDEYFSIDANNSARSGLPIYKANSGFNSANLGGMALYSFTRTWGLVGILRHTRWFGDAANSPIIRQEGSKNQVFGALAITYRF